MAFDRLITVLEIVAAAGRPLAPSEVQDATGLPRPTCYRLLRTLGDHRLLEFDGSKYRIGARLVRIALFGQTDDDARRAAAPMLKDAAIAFGEAVFLSRFRDERVEIIHVETPDDPARSFVHPGLGARPLHACSCSKAIAAFADPAFRKQVFAGPMRAYTERTKQDPEALRAEFEAIRRTGFATCVEEVELGVSSVAVPIRIGEIGAAFSIGATGPVRRFTPDRREEIGHELIAMAGRTAAALNLQAAISA